MKISKTNIGTLMYTVIIVSLSFIPGKSVKMSFPHADKVMHCLAFAGMGFLLGLSNFKRIFFIGIIWIILSGIISELIQFKVPNRDPDFLDFLCDAVGGITFFLLTYYIARKFKPANLKANAVDSQEHKL